MQCHSHSHYGNEKLCGKCHENIVAMQNGSKTGLIFLKPRKFLFSFDFRVKNVHVLDMLNEIHLVMTVWPRQGINNKRR